MKELARYERAITGARQIAEGIRDLGVEPGAIVIVHCSLSAFGFVAGGEQSVVEGLRTAVGDRGTMVMPSQSWQLCDPDFLNDPAYDDTARAMLRSSLPAYDPALTPTRSMGRVAELFRSQPGVVRSRHPHRSFAAQGPAARLALETQPDPDPFGEESPLARLYDLGATVLLLGVGYASCTGLHLAEGRAARTRPAARNGVVEVDERGHRHWRMWDEVLVDDSRFPEIGRAFEQRVPVPVTRIGDAECRAVPLAPLVDFAADVLRGGPPRGC